METIKKQRSTQGKKQRKQVNRNLPLADITPNGYKLLTGLKATLRG
jgi:hypothetical protein